MMSGWYGPGFGGVWMGMAMFAVVALIGLSIWLMAKRSPSVQPRLAEHSDSAMEQLRRRLSAGEITIEEYERIAAKLQQ